jgi:hypothetical protein
MNDLLKEDKYNINIYNTIYINMSDDEENDPFKVLPLKNNKSELYQPECSLSDITPKLPFGGLITGKSGSGKTNAMVHMLSQDCLLKDKFDYIYLFTAIKPDDDLIKPLKLDKSCIFENFTEDDVKKITDKLEAYIKKNGFKKCPSVLMLFDDILSNKEFLKSKTLIKLAVGNRHLNITYFILSQYYKKLPPVVRTNVKYLLFFPACLSECEKVAEEQCPANLSKKEFLKIIQYATKEQFNFLSINNVSKDRLRKNFNVILSI